VIESFFSSRSNCWQGEFKSGSVNPALRQKIEPIINSEGKVNIFNLAKNAGTSVDQIERFYAKYLPLSAEMARNLQTFGD